MGISLNQIVTDFYGISARKTMSVTGLHLFLNAERQTRQIEIDSEIETWKKWSPFFVMELNFIIKDAFPLSMLKA